MEKEVDKSSISWWFLTNEKIENWIKFIVNNKIKIEDLRNYITFRWSRSTFFYPFFVLYFFLNILIKLLLLNQKKSLKESMTRKWIQWDLWKPTTIESHEINGTYIMSSFTIVGSFGKDCRSNNIDYFIQSII